MTEKPINALLLEDDLDDQLIIKKLVGAVSGRGIKLAVAETLSQAWDILREAVFDLIIADLNLPDSRGMDTVRRLRVRAPATPIILLTGLNDEGLAVRAVREGAQDYLVKGEITANLLQRAAVYAIERNRYGEERETLLKNLTSAKSAVKQLTGLLPICACCKKIRNDKGYWERVEKYLEDHSDVKFTHGYCPECLAKNYPDLRGKKKMAGGAGLSGGA